ncbi:hypothetical protein FN846DRAFT_943128 [Sphaerosporella brunnea]|uniref:SMP-30/Gluconolactonase/LRE-like region domain-containing protein n=1 Tax=Sphaerosporella brunnea TaxID=1250544 RepID=A0A5J5F0K4_9PEZI|nr:hypothetical protein FN846DRAFT_943128 [Sphaerosporella brunnea]
MAPPGARSATTPTLSQLKWVLLLTLLALLWRTITTRSPFFLIPPVPSLKPPHTCRVYHQPLLSCASFTALPSSPLLLLSCGELWVFDPTAPETPPRLVVFTSLDATRDFRLGDVVAVSAAGAGEYRVFAVNHAEGGGRVEVLDLDLDLSSAEARHVATIRHPAIHSPHGIAALNASAFFYTNDFAFAGSGSGSGRAGVVAEALTAAPGGSLGLAVLTPEGAEVTTVARLAAAKGVAVDTRGNKVYAVSAVKGVYAFSYDPANPALTMSKPEFLRTAVLGENLVFSEESGELFLSGGTSLRGLLGGEEEKVAVEQAGRESITARLVKDGKPRDFANAGLRREEWRWESVFADDGSFYGDVSTGAVLKAGGAFVATASRQRGVLVCRDVPIRHDDEKLQEEQTLGRDEL